ncbi:Uncharacterised protein [Yersinia frederiksenii]|uniref:Uncharacterized protein n=2 Tax=Yersinia frederiksenii TaxID=29484 RepID=A0AAI8ZQ54_YERFR|nr:Uncharacterised protein [Yersinia frederiksenii]
MMDTKQRLPEEVMITLLFDPAFNACLERCLDESELIANFCRLYEVELPRQPRNGLEMLVDEATGYRECAFDKFFTAFIPFVHRVVYLPLKSQFYAAQSAERKS